MNNVQCSPFIMLYLGSIGIDHVISGAIFYKKKSYNFYFFLNPSHNWKPQHGSVISKSLFIMSCVKKGLSCIEKTPIFSVVFFYKFASVSVSPGSLGKKSVHSKLSKFCISSGKQVPLLHQTVFILCYERDDWWVCSWIFIVYLQKIPRNLECTFLWASAGIAREQCYYRASNTDEKWSC